MVIRSRSDWAVVLLALGCRTPGARDPLLEPAPAPTALERRTAGCYRMLGTVREIAPNFVLGERHGRGAGPEREGRLLRPRGSYNSALWRQVAPDTVELVWTTARSDSTRWEPGIVYSDALRARVGLAGDTLRGVARWRTDYSPADSFSFRAVRTTCGADVPR